VQVARPFINRQPAALAAAQEVHPPAGRVEALMFCRYCTPAELAVAAALGKTKSNIFPMHVSKRGKEACLLLPRTKVEAGIAESGSPWLSDSAGDRRLCWETTDPWMAWLDADGS
jgi:hypothetical protein